MTGTDHVRPIKATDVLGTVLQTQAIDALYQIELEKPQIQRWSEGYIAGHRLLSGDDSPGAC